MISIDIAPRLFLDLVNGKQVVMPTSMTFDDVPEGDRTMITVVSEAGKNHSRVVMAKVSHLVRGDPIDDWYIKSGYGVFLTINPEEILHLWLK